jgi:hypothetical protein
MSEDIRTNKAFQSDIAEVSFSHLLELAIALGAYRDGLILVGGWVPYLLLQKHQPKHLDFRHAGSIDIDFAVNPKRVNEERYASLLELVQEQGYQPKERTRFSFLKTVKTTDGEQDIQVDFLGPEYGGTTAKHRHQTVQDDFFLRKARGADIVFKHSCEIDIEGTLPGRAEGKTKINIADIVGSITMKGIVLGSRFKKKDAYDLFSLVQYYKNGTESVAEEIKPYKGNKLVQESLIAIQEKFRSQNAEGPNWVADFQEVADDERERLKTVAYLQIKKFLDLLKK